MLKENRGPVSSNWQGLVRDLLVEVVLSSLLSSVIHEVADVARSNCGKDGPEESSFDFLVGEVPVGWEVVFQAREPQTHWPHLAQAQLWPLRDVHLTRFTFLEELLLVVEDVVKESHRALALLWKFILL